MHNRKKKIQFQWIFLGNLPIMTKRGHFIINGTPRVLVNQIIRVAGVYYQQQVNKIIQKNKKQIYRTFYVDIISTRGVWLRFELDKKRQIWVRMKKTPKIPVFIFLKFMGFSKKILLAYMDNLKPKFFKKTKNQTQNFLFYLTQNFKLDHNFQQTFIYRKFFNSKIYDLGLIGRKSLNYKLGLRTQETILTPSDFLKITYSLLDLPNHQDLLDDIDNLSNRRIRTVGELLKIQLFQAIFRLNKILEEKMKKNEAIASFFTTRPMNSVFREFFGSCQLSQFLDQTNPLSELTHKRRISCLGPNGIQRETAGMDIRGIHATYFGRICPIETPEGQNAGLVNSLTIFSKKNADGFLESIFHKIYKGQIQKQLEPIYLTASHEQEFIIHFGEPQLSESNFLKNKTFTARHQQQFVRISQNNLQLGFCSSFQIISIATSLIPFLEHNDANRVLMGSNMQRQSVPLLLFESAKIRNSVENRVISDSGYCIQSKFSGLTLYSSKTQLEFCKFPNQYKNQEQKKIIIKNYLLEKKIIQKFYNQVKKFKLVKLRLLTKFSKKNPLLSRSHEQFFNTYFKNHIITIDHFKFSPKIRNYLYKKKFLRKFTRLIDFKQNCLVIQRIAFSKNHILLKEQVYQISNKKYQIWLKNFQKTNQGTYLIQKPIISTLEWVQNGDLLSDCATSKNGKLALGQNLLIAYLPWEGFNFEDAIIINQNLVLQEKYTSLHIEKYEVDIHETLYGLERITSKLPIYDPTLNQLDENGIIQCGCFVKEGTLLVGKVTPIENKPLLPHEKLLYDIVGKEIERVKDTSLRAPKSTFGRVIYISLNDTPYKTKISGPIPFQKICIYIAEKRKLKIGDKMAGRHGNKGIISKILSAQDLPFLLNGEILDLILNPLGVPSRMNVGQLFECLLGFTSEKLNQDYQLEIFDEKYGFDASRSLVYERLFKLRKKFKQKWYFSTQCTGKLFLFDGRTGEKYQQPTTVGKSYIMKLIHLVDDKMHARSTGPYSLVTQQPLKGRSKYGGQRFGEMEVWALEGFGSAFILQELLTVKSDDTRGRTKIIENILKNSKMMFGTPESFKVLLRELQSLCLNIKICQTNIS
uniref:DNA-directed RNA polymerase subunit beta n=1 Tax=Bryopsis sp. HV04063 TaxID=1979421 RepID=A0A2P0QH21_9CHLO|nr:RNA polymerase b-subunit [Bryopsis sp. HV04063]ARO74070.1 RNA polymerase b-subunit [Bryopsis sp. HV04063]